MAVDLAGCVRQAGRISAAPPAYAGGWKKFEPVWDALIRTRQVLRALPVLEKTLAGGS